MARSNIRGGRSNGIRVLFAQEVAGKLEDLAKDSPQMLDRVLEGVSYAAKKEAQKGFRSQFSRRTGKFEKGIQYLQIRRAYYRLKAPNLASIYEYNGAHTTPKDASVLRFTAANGQLIFAKYVDITPRPFFYPSIRRFVNSGELTDAMDREIDRVIREKEL
jgi:hypothetical protein